MLSWKQTNSYLMQHQCFLVSRYKNCPDICKCLNVISQKETSDRGFTKTSRCEIQPADSERLSFDAVSVGEGYSICILKQIYEAQDIVCILSVYIRSVSSFPTNVHSRRSGEKQEKGNKI